MVPFEPKIVGVTGAKAKDPNNVKRRKSKLLDNACQWAWKAYTNLTVFLIKPLDKQTLLSSTPSTKRPVYACKNLQIVQVNAINPFPIPLIYNAASLGIDCCLRIALHGWRDMHYFYRIGFLVFTNVIDTFHTVDTIGLCLPFKRDCYLFWIMAYVGL